MKNSKIKSQSLTTKKSKQKSRSQSKSKSLNNKSKNNQKQTGGSFYNLNDFESKTKMNPPPAPPFGNCSIL